MKNIALITGASSGIGKELAIEHARHKGDLVIVARRQKELEELKFKLEKEFDIKVKVIAKDLTLAESAKEIYNELKSEGIEIDILINNAGFGGVGKYSEQPWELNEAMIDLNIKALSGLTRIFLPDFIERNSGKIMNVSSIASYMPGPLQSVYFATKAYISSFSNAIAEELSDTNITVSTLLPGVTNTEFLEVSGMNKTSLFQKTISAEKVAKIGYKEMLKGKLNIHSGMTIGHKLLISLLPFTPKKITLKQIRAMHETEN